jgi:hypothetical protein
LIRRSFYLLPIEDRMVRAAAAYWDTHSFAEHAQETTDAGIRFVRRPKRAISIRLDPEDIAKVEAMAEAKGLARSFYEKRKLGARNPIMRLRTSGSATDRCRRISGSSRITPTTTSNTIRSM